MKYPKLKHPRLCRILTYVVVIGGGMLPVALAFLLPLPGAVRVAVVLVSLGGLLVYLLRNFVVLMSMDLMLAMLSCHRTARTKYSLPVGRKPEALRRSILAYGTACEPTAIRPRPSALRYRFSTSWTVYARGIERVVAAYELDILDPEMYRAILSSAKANSKAQMGRKKPRFLDRDQKKAPLHRVTVVLILAHRVDRKLAQELYELVRKGCGDEQADCLLPCVVDLEQGSCVFDGMRVPYIGFGYAVKNRGIRIIHRLVFGGKPDLRGNNQVIPVKDLDPEQSLWAFWRECRKMAAGSARSDKRRYAEMTDREVRVEDGCVFLKWEEQLLCQYLELDEEKKTAQVDAVHCWYFPKVRPIHKRTIAQMEARIREHFDEMGYRVEFVDRADEAAESGLL